MSAPMAVGRNYRRRAPGASLAEASSWEAANMEVNSAPVDEEAERIREFVDSSSAGLAASTTVSRKPSEILEDLKHEREFLEQLKTKMSQQVILLALEEKALLQKLENARKDMERYS